MATLPDVDPLLWSTHNKRSVGCTGQGAMMGAPGYAPWHGFFELQQDMYKLGQIHAKRMESGQIE